MHESQHLIAGLHGVDVAEDDEVFNGDAVTERLVVLLVP